MIRFASTILIAVALLGGVGLCQYLVTRDVEFKLAREAHGHGSSGHEEPAETSYVLVLTAGFDAMDDPFALRTGDGANERLVVRQGDRVLLSHTRDVRRGERIAVTNLAFRGESVDLLVEASPAPVDAAHPCPLRLELRRAGVPCDDRTLWSGGDGQKLTAEVRLSLKPKLQTLDRGLTNQT